MTREELLYEIVTLEQENKQLKQDVIYHNEKRIIYCNRINECVKHLSKDNIDKEYLYNVLIGNYDEGLKGEENE